MNKNEILLEQLMKLRTTAQHNLYMESASNHFKIQSLVASIESIDDTIARIFSEVNNTQSNN